MGRKKLIRIEESLSMPNILEPERKESVKILSDFINNQKPIILEIGCGKGDFILKFANKNPNINYIGVDVKSVRLWTGAKNAAESKLNNILFVHGFAADLPKLFSNAKVQEIWIFFPDPHPEKKAIARRLISPEHLTLYKSLLAENGIIHFKTDDTALFIYASETLKNFANIKIVSFTSDFYSSEYANIFCGEKTKYEERHIERGEIIKYISFKFLE